MGIRLIKDADDGELYILPDEKKSMKNAPQFMQEDAFMKIMQKLKMKIKVWLITLNFLKKLLVKC